MKKQKEGMKQNMSIDFFELVQEVIHEERKIDEILEDLKEDGEALIAFFQEIAEQYEQQHRIPRVKKVIEPTPKEKLDTLYEQINESLDKYEKETFHQLVAKKHELVKRYPFLAIFM